MIDKEAESVIKSIIKNGNEAEIRKKGGGYIILEVKKTIRYSTPQIGVGESHRG